MRSNKPILLIEDDHVDAMIVKRALTQIKVPNRLDIAVDGEEALALLKNPNHENPCLILLDLNMPRMNGLEFLDVFKQDATLKRIPVIVLTSSGETQDKINSFNFGVAGYFQKPIEYQQFVEIVKIIDRYWTLSELSPEV